MVAAGDERRSAAVPVAAPQLHRARLERVRDVDDRDLHDRPLVGRQRQGARARAQGGEAPVGRRRAVIASGGRGRRQRTGHVRRPGDARARPAAALGVAQRVVGAGQQPLRRRLRSPERRPTRARRQRLGQLGPRGPSDGVDQAAGQLLGFLGLGGHGDHRELVTALAAQHVLGAQLSLQRVGDPAQRLVACLVAKLVVDLLEPVEIEDDERERLAVTPGARGLALQRAPEAPVVADSRQRVGLGDAHRLGLADGESSPLPRHRRDHQVGDPHDHERGEQRRDRHSGEPGGLVAVVHEGREEGRGGERHRRQDAAAGLEGGGVQGGEEEVRRVGAVRAVRDRDEHPDDRDREQVAGEHEPQRVATRAFQPDEGQRDREGERGQPADRDAGTRVLLESAGDAQQRRAQSVERCRRPHGQADIQGSHSRPPWRVWSRSLHVWLHACLGPWASCRALPIPHHP